MLLWLVTLVLTGGDLVVAYTFGIQSRPCYLGNNLVLVFMVGGVTNFWAQAGRRAHDLAIPGSRAATTPGAART